MRVDVFPRADGRPVADLRAEDFVVEEDGVAQTISTFEHIVIRDGTAPETRADPRNVRESNQMAGDPRNRLFVLFLDTFHVTDPAAWHNGRSRHAGKHRRPPAGRGADGPADEHRPGAEQLPERRRSAPTISSRR